MHCPTRQAPSKKFGRTKDGRQKYRCRTCRRVQTERKERPALEIRIPRETVVLSLTLLCEGRAIRAIERVTGVTKKSILRLLTLVGPACERLQAELFRDVPVEDVEADELWTTSRTSRRPSSASGSRTRRPATPTPSSASSATPSSCSPSSSAAAPPPTRTTSWRS
jgi:transposase-like protein